MKYMSIDFNKLINNINSQIQESQQTPIRANKKKTTLKHIIMKNAKKQDKM